MLLALLSTHALAQTSPQPPPEIPKVQTAHPQQKDIKQSVKLPATLVANQQVTLLAKVAGYIKTISVDKGDVIKKDQVLAELSAPEMASELALANAKATAARADLAKVRASIELESVTHHRLAALHDKEPGAVTQEDVDVSAAKEKIAQSATAAAQASVAVADAEVNRLKTMLDYLTIRAPFDGVISQRFVDEGAFVSAAGTPSKPIVELTTTKKLRLVFELPERFVPLIPKGHALHYSIAALPGKLFDATVSRRSDTIAEATRTMRVEADVDNADGTLATGMYAQAEIPLNDAPGTVAIPTTALRTIDGKSCVLAVENGVAKKYRVESLADDGTNVLVSGPLTAAMSIVVRGPATLTDGQHVEAQEAK